MTAKDTQSIKVIKADVAKKDFASARKTTEELEARHTNDDLNMNITDIINALANKDAQGANIAIEAFEKWYDTNVNY
ncbi:hypothetical protein [Acetilactobacillus jinshanensis]|uniref:Uncharacterized protein n=1 Tax=Acetilactobacillus jinshanensis TaxID=1720083 RepID=A0A4V1ALN0_9LACO|nr:hypothetical protein [Acetilactobacillus jinshanensis]QBP18169.1 hypothetical protein ELX58_03235 [Acetilactobacillus jinshanensis]URL61036.1 hypothetical protein HGK75_03295 [uncultured bacterium]